jgi:hypothetical protein
MRIVIHKGDGRHTLRCFREDGTSTHAPAGPGLPSHDLAHWVAERAAGVRGGFYGRVAAGRSLQDLSDPQKLREEGLTGDALVGEVLARALGSMWAGACREEQFLELIGAELGALAPSLTMDDVGAMSRAYAEILARWQALPAGESLILEWP